MKPYIHRRQIAIQPALVLGLPVGLSWLKLQARLRRDSRIDQLPGVG